MKLRIKRVEIENNPLNEVTSDKVFADRKIRDKNGDFIFDENGIFSNKIFGKLKHCTCGKQFTNGICPECHTRVFEKQSDVPTFYISFKHLDIPYMDIHQDFESKKLVEDLLYYRGFLYHGEYIEFTYHLDVSKYCKNDVLVGEKALIYLGATKEWYKKQVSNKLAIPHPKYRKIIQQGEKYLLGELNTIYLDILKLKNKLDYYYEMTNEIQDIFFVFNIKHLMLKQIQESREELFNFICRNKNSLMVRELKGQALTGAIRAVITNNFNLDEDEVLMGSYFAETLYPKLTRECMINNELDIDLLNKKLKDYHMLINRQPTIGQKSTCSARPVFSKEDKDKYVLQLNPIVLDGHAGDCDGDVFSGTSLYSKKANQQAKKRLYSKNYLECSNGSIRNGLPEDFVYSMKKAFKEENVSSLVIKNLLGVNTIEEAEKKLNLISREEYIKVYKELGKSMYSNCYIPNVGDFARAYKDNDKNALDKIEEITTFTDNYDDIEKSVNRKKEDYTEEESNKFMKSVIAANITDITESGYFYKQLMSSCDNMIIDNNDCHSHGQEIKLPLNLELFNYRVKFHFVEELGEYVEDYQNFLDKTNNLDSIHVRNFLTCQTDSHKKHFCKKCAGIYKLEHNTTFTPRNIGIFSSLMITEHATQASLDSMNKGTTESINVLLTKPIKDKEVETEEKRTNKITNIIEEIGNVGVESRYYEIALLSRLHYENGKCKPKALVSSFLANEDKFGTFIYRPNIKTFLELVSQKEFKADSTKTMLAFDRYRK